MSEQTDGAGRPASSLAVLKGFVRQRAPLERCELCGTGLAPEHSHVLRIANRQLVCACDPCALLFADASAATYKRVSRRITELGDFALTDEQWEALLIPIDLAFFLHSSPARTNRRRLSKPAGPTESLLTSRPGTTSLESIRVCARSSSTWRRFSSTASGVARSPAAAGPSLSRSTSATGWLGDAEVLHGISGGTVVWNEIAAFFAGLEARADSRTERARA